MLAHHIATESTYIEDSDQGLISLRGISENFDITEELLSIKDTTTGESVGDPKTEILLFLEIISKLQNICNSENHSGCQMWSFQLISEHIKELKTKPQGSVVIAHAIYSTVRATKLKLKLFCQQLSHIYHHALSNNGKYGTGD
ncbi:hypothetical protein RF11_02853 [Thelohanellus kitauei]|uniref:Uncharacterized protein n=1 Tax=Thelohanellus kitauei TaxID=669202 RepID=A0A0C2MEB1_THEKT|nr:hypothetical protein RF11_02853 [Thelohanellus kitauei]